NHNLNSVISTADAHGPLGRSLIYFNCEVLPILKGASAVNPTVNLLVGLLRPPTKAECQSEGILGAGASIARVPAKPSPQVGLFSSLEVQPFAGVQRAGVHPKGGKGGGA
ncbi:MAG TPA: hypothetical protein VKG62_02045, partial [Solirubrobacteraceae bacterium]|nr:hypothetical protein [Solirubrobacteraceae bacterium]